MCQNFYACVTGPNSAVLCICEASWLPARQVLMNVMENLTQREAIKLQRVSWCDACAQTSTPPMFVCHHVCQAHFTLAEPPLLSGQAFETFWVSGTSGSLLLQARSWRLMWLTSCSKPSPLVTPLSLLDCFFECSSLRPILSPERTETITRLRVMSAGGWWLPAIRVCDQGLAYMEMQCRVCCTPYAGVVPYLAPLCYVFSPCSSRGLHRMHCIVPTPT